MPTDRRLDVLPEEPKAALIAAADRWSDRSLRLAERPIDAALLRQLAAVPDGEPMLRWVRETTGRPIDLDDFLFFLDDLLARGPKVAVVPASRARAYGILLHPHDVFGKKPRRYGEHGPLPLDAPPPQPSLEPAEDGDPPGPRWTARYQQPDTDDGKLTELEAHNPRFGRAVRSLFEQLASAGAFTWIEAGVRPRERGYLIYGSWFLGQAKGPEQARARIRTLEGYNEAWGLDVPIRWTHPGGIAAAIEAARTMAETYGVDYATPRGARRSSHYGGSAVDLVAVDLPRRLSLVAPSKKKRTFDLSAADHPRDLSLSPQIIEWVEAEFGLRKLRPDYPHWDDARPPSAP